MGREIEALVDAGGRMVDSVANLIDDSARIDVATMMFDLIPYLMYDTYFSVTLWDWD